MSSTPSRRRALALGTCLAILATSSSLVAAAPAYVVANLVSDGSVSANVIDPNLKNPWGLAFDPLGPAWMADNDSNVSTLYVSFGIKFPLTVPIQAGSRGAAGPTGIVYNPSLTQFEVPGGPATFIYATEAGTIAGWTQFNLLAPAVTMYDDRSGGAVYKGLALAFNGASNYLYATDFRNAKIDVFDVNFKKVTLPPNLFHDPALPAGFAPFGIQTISNLLFVSYAMQSSGNPSVEQAGPTLGIIDIYTPSGVLFERLVTGGLLNAPWGMAFAPTGFGPLSGKLLVGNFGDGFINAFDLTTKQPAGYVTNAAGARIRILGLWGLEFGGNILSPSNVLYFTAGINGTKGGLFGTISATQ